MVQTPGPYFRLRVVDRQEPVHVQVIVPKASERFYVSVIRRLSWRREAEVNTSLPPPLLEGLRGAALCRRKMRRRQAGIQQVLNYKLSGPKKTGRIESAAPICQTQAKVEIFL